MKKQLTILLLPALLLLANLSMGQDTYDWLSSAPDGYWKRGADGARWSGGLWDEPPLGNILRFNNTAQLAMNNNVSNYSVHQIIFGSSNTSSRTISGYDLYFNDYSGTDPKIVNLSTASSYISLNIIGDSDDPLEINPVSGNLGISGNINNNGSDIYVYGDNSKLLELSGIVSGSGKLIVKEYSKVDVSGISTFSGNVEIDEGEFWIGEAGSIGSSNVYVGNGAQTSNYAKFYISDMDGGTTTDVDIIVNNGNTGTKIIGGINTSGENTFGGTITLNGPVNLESVDASGVINFGGVISGSNNVTVSGAGIVKLTAANTFSGETTINSGILQIGNSGSLGEIDIDIALNGSLDIDNSITVSSISEEGSDNGGTIDIAAEKTLTINGADKGVCYQNSISGDGNVVMAGTGTTVLSLYGTQDYTGTTTIQSGEISTATSIPNSDITVQNGGTFTVNGDDITIKSLTVEAGGSVNIEAGKSLTITGDCSNSGTLTIKSDATGTGSLLVNGTQSGNITAQCYITGYTTDNNGWHLLSSPVNNFDLAGSDFEPDDASGEEDDFYAWLEASYTWDNYETWGGVTTLTNGHGYLVAYETTGTKNFVGTPNTGSVDVTLTRTDFDVDNNEGWNLLGNPFQSGLTWDSQEGSDWEEYDDVQANIQILNSENTYVVKNSSYVIPPHQGFFVQVKNIGTVNNFTIPAADRVHNNTNIAKATAADQSNFKLSVYANENTVDNDILNISLNENSDESYDRYDMVELYGYGVTPQLYSMDAELGNLTIHSVNPSSIEESRIFTLGLQTSFEGTYTVEFNENTFGEDYVITLEDLFTGDMIDIEAVTSYEFTATPEDAEHRFNLHVNKSGTAIENIEELETVNVYAYNNQIYINSQSDLTNATVAIYNTMGQVVATQQVHTGFETIEVSTMGAYIVKVQAEEGVTTQKVIIEVSR